MVPELSRPVPIARIGRSGLTVTIRATADECCAVARRMGVPAIQSMLCEFDLTRESDDVSIVAKGWLTVELTRICVVSAEEFNTSFEDRFSLRFVPSGLERDDPDPSLIDEIPYSGEIIDLGEAAVEQLGLALDPYPRMDGATIPDVFDNSGASPFSALGSRPEPNKTRH